MTADGEMGMAATKLQPPALPTRLVERTRLHTALDGAVARSVPFVLVSAPAGSGKSTMLAAWAAHVPHHVAWLQVDDVDSDPARLWASLVAAIARHRPGAGEHLAPLVVGSAGDDRVIVPALVNELVNDDARLVVVIDDYHLIDDPTVHRGIERLIDLCPPQLTLIIATRVDPPFRLGRMRVRNRISEVRANELRFAVGEAAGLLGTVGDTLTSAAIDDLCARTEGWAAGLVLAGLSLERAPRPEQFVHDFRGDDQLVVGYLGDELLATMDPHDRLRMLQTSVLDRFNGPLVDAVTASVGGARWLTDIAARNQLIVRLDNTGDWFRYHHLLRDLLALEATRTFPEQLPALHSRAAEWFEAQADHDAAVQHRLAAGDVAGAIGSMRHVGPNLLGRGQVRTLRRLLQQIGPAAADDAVCALLWGWCDYLGGQYATAQQWLDTALALAPPDLDRVITTPLAINVALGRGDVTAALEQARMVTALDDLPTRPAELATAVGAAYTWAGLPTEAREALAVAVGRAMAEHRLTAQTMALVSLAINELEVGNLAAAHDAADTAMTTAQAFGLAGYHGVAPALAVRARSNPDPVEARADATHAVELARRATTDLGRAFVMTTVGDTLLAQGDEAGTALLAEARTIIDRCTDPGIAGTALARAESRHHVSAAPAVPVAHLVEQLTERELALLRYLPSQLTQREIANELFVSLNTVKTHSSAIYRKLGVTDRKSAVHVARTLHLL
ncbi:MAG: LuxR C-terminal-related transcriptional regulator [Actinomycetota bacterium]|nr:LuxR C-terminal-related transcriptional regulator [Actinomycetota bacterium]